ncbi:MAG: hypothetical protein JO279_18225 [Verrucomicrobia bacterium]|nr:hypothetical protein [Verrucomicrobiota bacterium]
MDKLGSAEEKADSSADNKAEEAAKAAADMKAEELRIALETKTEQGKSTLGNLPKPGT